MTTNGFILSGFVEETNNTRENPAEELIPQMVKIQSTVVQFVQRTDLYFHSHPGCLDFIGVMVMENF